MWMQDYVSFPDHPVVLLAEEIALDQLQLGIHHRLRKDRQ
jgi:hypothetical protein